MTMTVNANTAPRSGGERRSQVVMLTWLLAATGLVADLQGVGLSPLVSVVVRDLGLTTMEITWAINALLIGGAIAVGLTSRIGDIAGHRRVLLVLTVCGLIGSLMAAMASNGMMLTIGRFLQGLAVATPLAWGMLRPRATASQFQFAASILSLVICIFTPISLVLGGVFLELGYSWTGVFWILSACYLLMLVLAILSPETPAVHRATVKLDLVGALLLGIWLTAFLLSLSIFRIYGITHPLTLGLFFGSIGLFGIWLVQQRRHSAPLMDFRNVDIRQMLGGYLGLVQTSVVASSLYIMLPAMLRSPAAEGSSLGGYSLLWASMPLMFMLPGAILSPLLAGKLMPRIGPRGPMVVFGLIGTLSFIGFATMMTEIWHAYFWMTVYGIGVGGCYAIGWTLVASSARPDNMGLVMSSMQITSKVAAAVTVAVVLLMLDPGRGFAGPETYRTLYIWVAVTCLLFFVVAPLLMMPGRLRDAFAEEMADASPAE